MSPLRALRLLGRQARRALPAGVFAGIASPARLAGHAVFRRAGVTRAYSAALMRGNRNMGLMLVVTAGTAGEAFSLYVGIAQIPMYFAPLLLAPFLRRGLR